MDFFDKILDAIASATDYLVETTEKIDNINFQNLTVTDYFGYVHYFMGDLAYTSMMGMIVVIAGINIFNFILATIGKLKNLLPW